MWDIPGTKHISRGRWGFCVEKKINGKYCYFAHGTTLIIALMKRDWIIANNWTKKYPTNYKYILKKSSNKYEVIKRIDGKLEHFGMFNSYEEAKEEVEKCKSVNWDFELLCELDERTNGTEWLPKRMRNVGVW